MFALVRTVKKEKRAFLRFKKSRISGERIDLPNEECFFIITAEAMGKAFPYEEILHFSDRLKSCLIFEKDSPVSYNSFRPTLLEKRLLFHCALKHLEKAGKKPSQVSVCVCDAQGIYVGQTDKLLPFASKIHIISDCDAYHTRAAELLTEYGASVTISSRFDKAAADSSVIVSHLSDMIPVSFTGTLITNSPRCLPFARCVPKSPVSLPTKYEKLLPPNFDVKLFAAALYEKCGCEDIFTWCEKNCEV